MNPLGTAASRVLAKHGERQEHEEGRYYALGFECGRIHQIERDIALLERRCGRQAVTILKAEQVRLHAMAMKGGGDG